MSNATPQPYTYDPYGYTSINEGRLGFKGELYLSGRYALGNGYRFYAPALMRLHSPDNLSPFAEGDLNAYSFCQGDPVNHNDPSGHWRTKQVVQPILLVAAKAFFPNRNTIAPRQNGQRFAQDAFDAFVTTALPGNDRVPTTTPSQSYLGAHVKHMKDDAAFIWKVKAVVANKESHGRPPINLYMQNAYIRNVNAVRQARISSVTAHLNMREEWSSYTGPKAKPVRTVARVLHLGSAVISGVEDQAGYKTGAFLRRG